MNKNSLGYQEKLEDRYTYVEVTGMDILIRGRAFRGLGPLGLGALEDWPAGSAAASLALLVPRTLGTTGVAGGAREHGRTGR